MDAVRVIRAAWLTELGRVCEGHDRTVACDRRLSRKRSDSDGAGSRGETFRVDDG